MTSLFRCECGREGEICRMPFGATPQVWRAFERAHPNRMSNSQSARSRADDARARRLERERRAALQ